MSIKKIIIYFCIFILSFWINNSFASINMTVSPIKYELEADPGETITKQAKITNNSSQTIHIITWKSDFIASWDTWKPKFIRRSEEVLPQELSNRITIDTKEFDLNPWETKKINFTINVPETATPGWHYWAIFFKNKNSETSSSGQVWINVDYWVLILLKVNWEIITDIEIWEPIIKWTSWWKVRHMDVCNENWWDFSWDYYDWECWENPNKENIDSNIKNQDTKQKEEKNNKKEKKEIIDKQKKKDDCIIDFTASLYDWKCIDDTSEIIKQITWNIDDIDFSKDFDNKNFDVKIEVPIENKWNTHVKPKWKITLIDEDGKIIKWVWKEIITNKKWAIIWEKIVDYIPFNDIWWNVLPNTKRNYKAEFKWFPYKTYDEYWNIKIKYWTPSEYYTKKELDKKMFLMPWERMCVKDKQKNIKAKFNIVYKDENWEDIEFNSAKEFKIKYKQKEIELNPYFFIILWLFFGIFIILFLIFRKKKKRCVKCNKKIDKNMKVCPYCWKKQNKKNKKNNLNK